MNNSQLYQALCLLGDNVKLKLNIDTSLVLEKLQEFENYWVPYNQKKDTVNNRYGLALTSQSGKQDDTIHLNSFGYAKRNLDIDLSESNFNKYTPAMNKISEIKNIVDLFSDIGRVHLLRVGKGGFFPPHRDFPQLHPEYIRLSCVFGKAKPENYCLLFDGKPFYHDPGFLYFNNYQKDHSLFSFSDYVYVLIITVKLSEDTYNKIIKYSMSE
jgi:hypothetical protein